MVFPVLCDKTTWFHVIGYIYATVVPAYFLARISRRLWVRIATPEGVPAEAIKSGHRNDLPAILGFLERTMYVASWTVGHPEFIGLWLGLKVAGGWNAWTHGYEVRGTMGEDGQPLRVNGRHMFNTQLVGSALSALSGVTGGLIITWLVAGDWSRAVWVGLANLALTVGVWIWADVAPVERPKSGT